MTASRNRAHAGEQGPPEQNFLMFSSSGGRGLVTQSEGSAGPSSVGYVAPFWAVMLTDRDNQHMVNMIPYTDEITVPRLVSKSYRLNFMSSMKANCTFLSNAKDLAAGDLLVLPYDGGCDEVFLDSPPQSAPSSGLSAQELQGL